MHDFYWIFAAGPYHVWGVLLWGDDSSLPVAIRDTLLFIRATGARPRDAARVLPADVSQTDEGIVTRFHVSTQKPDVFRIAVVMSWGRVD